MTWLRDNGLTLLLVLLVVGWVQAEMRSARNKGMADAEAATVARLEPMVAEAADSASAARARAHAASLVADSATKVADSVTAELHVTRETSAATIADLTARLRAIDAGSAERAAAAQAEADANDGWVRHERYVADTDSLRRRAEIADSVALEERAAKEAERSRGDALEAENAALKVYVGELRAEAMGAWEYAAAVVQQSEAKDRQIAALERAASSGGLFPDLGVVTQPLLVAVGIVAGYGIAEVRR